MLKRNLIFIVLAMFSTATFAHDMPIGIKKQKLIESLLDSSSFPLSLKDAKSLEDGDLTINMPEAIKHPFLGYYTTAWMDEGDQDVEEYHFYFSSDEGNFYLNCNIVTTVLLPIENSKATVNKFESLGCVLKNKDNKRKKNVNLSRITWETH